MSKIRGEVISLDYLRQKELEFEKSLEDYQVQDEYPTWKELDFNDDPATRYDPESDLDLEEPT